MAARLRAPRRPARGADCAPAAGLLQRCPSAIIDSPHPAAVRPCLRKPSCLLGLRCALALTKRARAISCSAPPPLSTRAPDSPVPAPTPASVLLPWDGAAAMPKSASPPGAAPKSVVFDVLFEKRQQRHQSPLACHHVRCCNVCRQPLRPPPAQDRSELHQPPPKPASQRSGDRSQH